MSEVEGMEANDPTPMVLEHFVGQCRAIELAKVNREFCYATAKPFPSAVLVGPPGVGKTLLAKTIAREMGVECVEALGQNLNDASELRGFLVAARHKDVVFIDEADDLPRSVQVLLYRAIEDRKLFLPTAVGSLDGPFGGTNRCIQLEDFTILAATNNEFSLVKPLRDRFDVILRFGYYSREELVVILRRRVTALGWDVAEGLYPQIAARSQGVPRLALRLLRSCYRVAQSRHAPAVAQEDFDCACTLEGLDDIGLDPYQRDCLQLLADADGPVRENVIGSKLGLPAKTVAHVVEPFLIRSGFVDKTDRGRRITANGIRHLRATEDSG